MEKILDIEDGGDNAGKEAPPTALRRLRVEKGMTLGNLSEKTGLPVSTLSKLENGRMSLSYDKLTRMARGLGVDVADVLSPRDPSEDQKPSLGRRSITRGGEEAEIVTEPYIYRYPNTDLLKKNFNPMLVEVRCRSIDEFGTLIRHKGEEYVLVLEGEIDFHTDLYAPVRLKLGDSLYFDSSMGHAYIAAANGSCRLLSVCSATTDELKATMPAVKPEV